MIDFLYGRLIALDKKFDKVDNTADLDKPVSTATQAAIDAHNEDYTILDNRTSNVDNTSDLDKPVSTATQAEIDAIYTRYSNVDNTADLDKPISTAVQAALDTKEGVEIKLTAFNKDYGTTADTTCEGNDPRLSDSRTCNNTFDDVLITKTNLSLQNVDNTSDADKPASTVVDGRLTTLENKTTNIDNTSDANKPISLATQTALDGKEPVFTKNTAFNKNFGNLINTVTEGNDPRLSDSRTCNNTFDDVLTTKTNLGLENVDNTADLDKPISDLTQAALDVKQNAANAVTTNTPQDITDAKNFTVRPTVNGLDVWDAGNLTPGIWWTQIWGGNTADLEWTLVAGRYMIVFETLDSTVGAEEPFHKLTVTMQVHTQGHYTLSTFTSDINPDALVNIHPQNGDRIFAESVGWRVKGWLLRNGTIMEPLAITEIWQAA